MSQKQSFLRQSLQRNYHAPLSQIKDLLLLILRLRGLSLAPKNLCIEALDLFVEHNIYFASGVTAERENRTRTSPLQQEDTLCMNEGPRRERFALQAPQR
jgi:hypothetical protein